LWIDPRIGNFQFAIEKLELKHHQITKLSFQTMFSGGLFRSITSPFLDFVYPPICVSCKQALPYGSQKVCEKCWNSIDRISRVHPLYIETREKLLADGTVSDLVSVFVFQKEGAFQHIAHALKYDGFESIGRELGERLGITMKEWNIHADVLIPIPLHKAKQRERGFNQAEQIARGVASVTGVEVCSDAIRRVKHTQTQTQLTSDERKKNMEAAFAFNPSCSKRTSDKTCVLIDDVITTGATIQSCAQELMGAGAANVIASSAALAQ
jgi:ComF family protein